jgi:cytochrome P450
MSDPGEQTVVGFDIRRPPDDPWPLLASLRDLAALARFPDAGCSALLRYEAVRDAFASPERFSSRYNEKPDGDWSIVSSDPPEHTRQRKILGRVLTPQRVTALEPRIREIADQLVDELPGRGPVEVMASFGFLLPVTVLAELLGVPDADRAQFKRWSDEQLAQSLQAGTSDEARAFKQWALREVQGRRADGGPTDDLIGMLALTEVEGDQLDPWEAASTLVLLVVAGHETTTNAIGNTIRLLLEEPGMRERLTAEPGLIPAFVEESLRLDPPVTALPRRTRCPVTVDGEELASGEVVLLHVGAANRDPAFAADPDACVVGRTLSRPQLAFGYGIHLCLGATLARAEIQIAVETLLARLDGLRPVTDQIVEQTLAYIFRGPRRYFVDYDHRRDR